MTFFGEECLLGLLLLLRLSVPFINKDASSDSSLRNVSMKHFCGPFKTFSLQKRGDFLQKMYNCSILKVNIFKEYVQTYDRLYLFQDIEQNQVCWEGGFVRERRPEPEKRVVVEPLGLVKVTVVSQVWRTLQKPHL